MAFKLWKSAGEHPAMEYHQMTSNEASVLGSRYHLASGYPTLTGATTLTELIAMATVAASTAANRALVPFIRVREDDLFVADVVAGTNLATTDKGTFFNGTTDGAKVASGTSGPSIEVVGVDGSTATGNKVYVKLITKAG